MNVDTLPTMDPVDKHKHGLPVRSNHMAETHQTHVAAPASPAQASILRWLVSGSLVVGAVSIGVMLWGLRGPTASTAQAADDPEKHSAQEATAISVKTVCPRCEASFQLGNEQPAFVVPYYQADLQARVAGPITYLEVAVGSRVKAGQVLVKIDAPDLEEDVYQKSAIVAQRQKELALSQAYQKTAEAAVEFARAVIPQKESDRQRAISVRSFREKELKRFKGLASKDVATQDIVDERVQYYEAAIADVQAAEAGVEKAKSGLSEAKAKLDAAVADINLKSALVEVARKDVDHAKAMLSFATITAPFDGVIVRRNVDPGAFVQNASTARTEPMLTVARTDIFTVYMKLPDNYAPYVTNDTEAVIQLGVLPDCEIRGKVTRFAPSLETPEHDRTMRVEVDLFNGSAEAYRQLTERAKTSHMADLKDGRLPTFPIVNGNPSSGLEGRLLPGMYGTMRLALQKFSDASLVPSTALINQGGRNFLFLVKNGKAVLSQVDVQVDNGRLAKVVVIEPKGDQQIRRPLTKDETVIVSNQGELSDGQAVKATPSEW